MKIWVPVQRVGLKEVRSGSLPAVAGRALPDPFLLCCPRGFEKVQSAHPAPPSLPTDQCPPLEGQRGKGFSLEGRAGLQASGSEWEASCSPCDLLKPERGREISRVDCVHRCPRPARSPAQHPGPSHPCLLRFGRTSPAALPFSAHWQRGSTPEGPGQGAPVSSFIILQMDVQLLQHHLPKRASCSSVQHPPTVFTWSCCSDPWTLVYFVTNTTPSGRRSSTESRAVPGVQTCPSSSVVVGNSGPVPPPHLNFGIRLSTPTEQLAGIGMGIVLTL